MRIYPNMDKFKRGILLSALSGVLLSLCFEPFNLSFLCLVALVPLFYALFEQDGFWRLFICSWTAVFVQSMISFQWVHFVAREFGSLSWLASFFVLIAFSLFTNLYLQIFAVLYYFFRRAAGAKYKWLFLLVVIPSLYVIAEAVDPRIFNWSIGDALSSYKYMFQFADVFGVLGLSFFCVVINAVLYSMISTRRHMIALSSLVISTLIFLFLYGHYAYQKINEYQTTCPVIEAGVVQANIGNPIQLKISEVIRFRSELGVIDGEDNSDSALIFKKYDLMSSRMLKEHPDVDIVIWPETAFPGYYNQENPKMRSHVRKIREEGVPFFIGAYYFEILPEKGNYYNSAVFVGSDKEPINYYHKHVLLPFGEYMPLGSVFPWLKGLVSAVGDFASGSGPSVIKAKLQGIDVNFGPTICYEILKASYVRKFVDEGANVMLNFTNDSWFGSVEPYQHLRLARMRAVENRRPLIRTTNTGITALIDMNGEVVSKSGLLTEELMNFKVPVCAENKKSFYSEYGWLFLYSLILLSAVFYAFVVFSNRRKK